MSEFKTYIYTKNEEVLVASSLVKPTAKDCIEVNWPGPICEEDPLDVYQEAWVIKKGKLTVDLDKAKQVKLREMRALREIHLDEFDKLQARYIGSGDKEGVKRVEKSKEMLRDLPELIDWDSVKSVKELYLVRPPLLHD